MSTTNPLDTHVAAHYFTFDGTSSYTYKCLVFPADVDNAPEIDYSVEAIPGRNGDIILSNNRMSNVEHSYDCIIYENFDTNYISLRSFLLSKNGYCRLSDTIHTDEYYHAYFSRIESLRIRRDRSEGKFRLTFIRKPQRFLTSGEEPKQVNNGLLTLSNPTGFPSFPIIYVYNSTLGDGAKGSINYPYAIEYGATLPTPTNRFTILPYTGSNYYKNVINNYGLEIDLETLQAYNALQHGSYTTTARYNFSSVVSYQYQPTYPFQLAPGTNYVRIGYASGTGYVLSEATIIPRWYRI